MEENGVTSLQITKQALKLLGDIADYFRRSKTKQVEWWIENEHRRIFQDGERSQVPAESISTEQQP
jgi:hypothetical protein